jgi:hypothetical protein
VSVELLELLEINVSVAAYLLALSDSLKRIDRLSGADVRGRTGQDVGHQSVRVIPAGSKSSTK